MLEGQLGLGLWRLELPAAELYCSSRALKIFGQEPRDTPVSITVLLESVVAEDRSRVANLMVQSLRQQSGFDETMGIRRPDGKVRIVECSAAVEVSERGATSALFGTIRDITERVQADNLSASRGNLLKSLLKNIPAAIAVLDRSMTYLAVSDHWVVGHGHKSARELIGKSHYALRPEVGPQHKADHERVLAGEVVRSARGFLRDGNGNAITQVCTLAPWLTPGGEVGGIIIMLPSVDQSQKFAEPASKPLAVNDDLPTMKEFLTVLRTIG